MTRFLFPLAVLALAFTACAQAPIAGTQGLPSTLAGKVKAAHRVVFYNVENLFDTLDTPDKIDEEYLPSSDLLWGTQRYWAKIDSLKRVILAASGGEAPALLGLAEIENAAVCEDLGIALAGEGGYRVLHRESPDMRGIDCALLVRQGKGAFKVDAVRGIRLNFPPELGSEEGPYTSRDILYVQGRFKGMKSPLHVFVNHWPSRRGGLEASEPRRFVPARTLRSVVDSLRGAEGTPAVLIMGDFNDEPDNRSLTEGLGASISGTASPDQLANLMGPADAAGEGSYNFRGTWNMLDQFIVSGALLPGQGRWAVGAAAPYQAPWMMYVSDRYGATPSRTFGGPNYYAGYSDHLPITLTLYRPK